MSKKIAIIGGGASGIMAAITAARECADVTVYERNERIGRKILSTGNGRCNYTNINAAAEKYHGENTAFVQNALRRFGAYDAIAFFKELGILPRVENEGKVFPYSCQASAVLDVLRFETERLNINIKTGHNVNGIEKNGKKFVVRTDKGVCGEYDRVILSGGGMAAPELGTNGDVYKIGKSFGHRIIKPCPTLVQIKTNAAKGLKGIKVQAKAACGSKSAAGEILFTDYGLSGPPIFWLSTFIQDEKHIIIDFVPDYTESELTDILKERSVRGLAAEYMLIGIVNRLVGINIIKYAGIAPMSKKENEFGEQELAALAHALKHRIFDIEGTLSWKNAQVTAGGISTNEVNSKTMESRIVKGLYFSGEILDVDGECGGYNLQWAWSSGYTAGLNAAK